MSLSGLTALHLALQKSYKTRLDWVEFLLQSGADLSPRDNKGRTPLHYACYRGNEKAVRLFLGHGADIFGEDSSCRSAIHYAAYSDNEPTLKVILDTATTQHRLEEALRGKDQRSCSTLHYEVIGYFTMETFLLLVRHGVEIDEVNMHGRAPLAYCLTNWRDIFSPTLMVRALVASRTSVTLKSKEGHGLGHLYGSASASIDDMEVSALQALAGAGLKFSEVDNQGLTILHHAAIADSLTQDTLNYLVGEVEVNISARDAHDKSTLDYAKERARKPHHEDTFQCYRWRMAEALLTSWPEQISRGKEFDRNGCSSDLHFSTYHYSLWSQPEEIEFSGI